MNLSSHPWLRATTLLGAVVVLLGSASARAQLITNGDFTLPGTTGQLTVNTTLTGWTGGGKEGLNGSQTTPPVFVFPSTGGSVSGDAFMGSISFYGNPTSPNGKPFVAADGDSDWAGSIEQTVTGLTVGHTYNLIFNWAGAQQTTYTGATTEKWRVSFGTDTQDTATVNTPSQGFLGWQSASMNFTPSSTSQLLKFLAVGTPGGQPPWLLLNGVSLTDTTVAAVPEPSSLATGTLVGIGLAIGGIRSRRKARATRA